MHTDENVFVRSTNRTSSYTKIIIIRDEHDVFISLYLQLLFKMDSCLGRLEWLKTFFFTIANFYWDLKKIRIIPFTREWSLVNFIQSSFTRQIISLSFSALPT